MPRLNPGRLAAARALLDVEVGRHADSTLQSLLSDSSEMPLARAITFGVLRRRGALDAVLSGFSKQPLQKLDAPVLTVLRIGLYELQCMRTPAHAAVDQAVQLSRKLKVGRASGFVNAVLRKGAKATLPDDPTLDHPTWLIERWEQRYGKDPVAQWCARMSEPAPLAICMKGEEGLGPAGSPGSTAGQAVAGLRWVDTKGKVEELPGYSEGHWWVMDPAAAATADLLQVQPGESVLDACAAPGGKTLRMAAQGANVFATDRSAERLERLQHSLDRTGLKARYQAADWTLAQPELGPFDAALVDAPCSGLGTTRRHPEIRWSRQPGDPAAHSLTQSLILERVAERVRPGGRIVYAVCSPEPEEGIQVVQDFVAHHPEWTLDATLETAPPSAHEDAFFAARLLRAGEGT